MNSKMSKLRIPAEFNEKNVSKHEESVKLKSPSMFNEFQCKSNVDIKKMVTPSDIISGKSNSKRDVFPKKGSSNLERCETEMKSYSGNANTPNALHNDEVCCKRKCVQSEKIIKLLEEEIIVLKKDIQKFQKEESERDKKFISDTTETKTLCEKYFAMSNEYEMEKSSLKFRIEELEQCISEMKEEIESLNLQLTHKHFAYEKLQDIAQQNAFEKGKIYSSFTQERERNDELLNKINSTVKEKEIINTEHSTLLTKFMVMKEDLENKTIEFSGLKHKLDNDLALLQCENEKLKSEVLEGKLLQERLETVNSKNKILKPQLDELEKENAELKENIVLQAKQLDESAQSVDSMQKELSLKWELENELQITLKQLQSNNKYLTIRLDALSEMIAMQETQLKSPSVNKLESLLSLWRQKVYELLILLKTR